MKIGFYTAAAGLVLLIGQTGVAAAPKAALPLVVYAEGGGKQPCIPSGYMGNAGAIKMDPQSGVNPHSGQDLPQSLLHGS